MKLLRSPNRLSVGLTALAAIGATVLSGCSAAGEGNYIKPINMVTERGTATQGSLLKVKHTALTIRHDDEVVELVGDGIDNICASPKKTVHFARTDKTAFFVEFTPGDNNGERIGIPIDVLPAKIQRSCADDADGIVWALRSYSLLPDLTITERN